MQDAAKGKHMISQYTKYCVKLTSFCGVCAAVALLLLLPSTSVAEDQSVRWLIVDAPQLEGPAQNWKHDTAGGHWSGYEGYAHTLGAGDKDQPTNYAVWHMGSRAGRQPVWVHIPRPPADVRATVRYHIIKNGAPVGVVSLSQRDNKGWQHLGTWDFNGASVEIRVYDNETVEDYRTVAVTADSRIGIDTAAMKCTADCGNYSQHPQAVDFFYMDEPQLGGTGHWYHDSKVGWGDEYSYTYGFGNSTSRTNWAAWHMGSRAGHQTVWVHIPKTPADVRATVNYRIHTNGDLFVSRYVDQALIKGWHRLGSWDFDGAYVEIRVYDNETREHYDGSNKADSRIGIDTVAMICVEDCGNEDSRPQRPACGTNSSWSVIEEKCIVYPDLKEGVSTYCDSGETDEWWTYKGECTSYVAWRLNKDGIPFHNTTFTNGGVLPYREGHRRWSHAKYWAETAELVGIGIGGTAAPGSVIQWANPPYGHLAYVEEVNSDGSIVISDMNRHSQCGLRHRVTISLENHPLGKASVIHFEELRP